MVFSPLSAEPIDARSFISVVSATFQPLFSLRLSDDRLATRTSLKNTSLKLAPPVIWRSGRISTPGARMSTMKHGEAFVFRQTCIATANDFANVAELCA